MFRLDDPSAGQDLEAFGGTDRLTISMFHLPMPASALPQFGAGGIAPIGEDMTQPWIGAPDLRHHLGRCVAILDPAE